MADIKQAAKWLREGKSVVRPKSIDDGVYSATDLGSFVERNNEDRAMLQVADLLANDWAIYEEENWEIAE